MSAMGETMRRARRANVTFVAASVAYYWLLSLVPMVVLAFAALQLAYADALSAWAVSQLAPALTQTGRDVVHRVIGDTRGAAVICVSGVVALAWAWVRLYGALEHSFERVYGAHQTEGLPERALAAAVVVPAISIGMALTASGVVTDGPGVLWETIQVGAIALALFPVFVTLPPDRPALRTAFLGATATAIAWTVLQLAFGLYAAYGSYSVAYGLLGAVILLVGFLYLGAVSLLLAVSLTASLDA